jgi:hypothetical protein
MSIYGYNPAWYYSGKYAFFHGNIKLSYFKLWICLGVFFQLFFTYIIIII